MIIYPAIDLRGGRCVRLVQGDFEQTTEYSKNPMETALHWAEYRASWLHLVDLDGARQEKPITAASSVILHQGCPSPCKQAEEFAPWQILRSF